MQSCSIPLQGAWCGQTGGRQHTERGDHCCRGRPHRRARPRVAGAHAREAECGARSSTSLCTGCGVVLHSDTVTSAHLQHEQYLVPRENSFKLIPQLNTVKMNEKIGHVHCSFQHELFQCTLILIAVLLIFGLTNLDFYPRGPLSSTLQHVS